MVFGLVASGACYRGATGLKRLLKADGSLDVSGVHGIGDIVGSLLTGVFATKAIGVEGSVWIQCVGVASVVAYRLVITGLLPWLTSLCVSLRVNEEAESDGLDIVQHAERMGT